jgi:hypothetical protein
VNVAPKRNRSKVNPRRRPLALRPGFLAAVFLALLFVGIRFVRFSEPMGLDQGLFVYFGQHIPKGDIPYRDIWDSKPPGVFYVYALALRLGNDIGWVYLLEGLFSAATAFLIYRLGRRLADARTGIASALVYVLFSHAPLLGGFWANAQAERFMELPIVASLMLLTTQQSRRRKWLLSASGMLAGTAILLKLVAFLIIPCALLFLYLSRKKTGNTVSSVMTFLIGVTFPLTAALVYFWSHGALSALWGALVTYKLTYAREIAGAQNLWYGILYPYIQFANGNRVFWALSLVGCVLLLRRRSALAYLIVLWYIASFAIVWMQRQFAGYHFIVLVAPVAVTAGCGAIYLLDFLSKPRLRTRLIAGTFVLALTFSFLMEISIYHRFYHPDVNYALGRIDQASYWGSFDRGIISYAEHHAAAQYLKLHTIEEDAVLVWGLAPGIYCLADRKAATKYVFHHVLLTDAPLSRAFPGLPLRRAAFMERIRHLTPAYILIGLEDPNGFEPLDSYRQMLRYPAFRGYVSAYYERDRRIGHFLLLRKR